MRLRWSAHLSTYPALRVHSLRRRCPGLARSRVGRQESAPLIEMRCAASAMPAGVGVRLRRARIGTVRAVVEQPSSLCGTSSMPCRGPHHLAAQRAAGLRSARSVTDRMCPTPIAIFAGVTRSARRPTTSAGLPRRCLFCAGVKLGGAYRLQSGEHAAGITTHRSIFNTQNPFSWYILP
jgi:hypothetical protein